MKKHTITTILIILFFGCTSYNSSSDADKFESVVGALEKQIQEDLVTDDTGGSISSAIVKGNKIVWSKAFGYSDRERKTLADTSTLYRTGSITKSFTAFLMMQLVEEGVIKLNDPVEMYLPEIRKLVGYAQSTKITFLELSTHTAGLIREPELEDAASGPIENWENKIIESIPHTSFQSRPGEKFSYSNIGYGILGLALSRAANKSFPELIQNKIFTPLRMKHSFFKVPVEMTPKLAKGMNGGPGELDLETPHIEHAGRGYKVPNGGIYSTPNDLARFAMANLGYPKLMNSENLESMQTGKLSRRDDYGLGFFIKGDQTGSIVSHGGAVAGYTAYFAFEPVSGYGVVIMRNYNFGKTDLQVQSIKVLNELRRLNSRTAK
jgi:CubicO group peptidase (beta-lactamase class C family)